jgi:hypothetical protein
MTAFLTICALTRPSTSVRKSSRRSDQRKPPRATAPKRSERPRRGGCRPRSRSVATVAEGPVRDGDQA